MVLVESQELCCVMDASKLIIVIVFVRYGVLVDPKILLVFLEDPYNWPSASLCVCEYFHIHISFLSPSCFPCDYARLRLYISLLPESGTKLTIFIVIYVLCIYIYSIL